MTMDGKAKCHNTGYPITSTSGALRDDIVWLDTRRDKYLMSPVQRIAFWRNWFTVGQARKIRHRSR